MEIYFFFKIGWAFWNFFLISHLSFIFYSNHFRFVIFAWRWEHLHNSWNGWMLIKRSALVKTLEDFGKLQAMAFNAISHSILLAGLQESETAGPILQWFCSFSKLWGVPDWPNDMSYVECHRSDFLAFGVWYNQCVDNIPTLTLSLLGHRKMLLTSYPYVWRL